MDKNNINPREEAIIQLSELQDEVLDASDTFQRYIEGGTLGLFKAHIDLILNSEIFNKYGNLQTKGKLLLILESKLPPKVKAQKLNYEMYLLQTWIYNAQNGTNDEPMEYEEFINMEWD